MTKGPLELRRTYPDVGAIRVSSGTHKKLTLRALERMCAGLHDAGRLEYLRLIRDRAITPLALYERIRGKDYRELPRPDAVSTDENLANAARAFERESKL